MASKYQRYLNEKRTSSRFSRFKESLEGAAKFTIGVGLAVGSGIGVKYLYDSGTLQKYTHALGSALGKAAGVGRNASSRVSSYMSALDETIKEVGFSRFMTGSADDILEERLKKGFTKAAQNAAKPLGGVASDVQEILLEKRTFKSKAVASRISSERLSRIRSEMAEALGNQEMLDDTMKFFKGSNVDYIINNISAGDLKNAYMSAGLDKKYGMDEITKASEQIETILSGYREIRKSKDGQTYGRMLDPRKWRNPWSREQLQADIKKVTDVIDREFLNSLKQPKDKGFMTKILGLRDVTIGDILDNPQWAEGATKYINGKFVEYDLIADLQHLVAKNPEARNLVAAKGLRIDAQGNLADLRYAKKGLKDAFYHLANSVKTPIVNINPFRMMHAITIEGIDKAERMAILRAGSKQPFLTGSAEALTEDLMYVGGKAFNIRTGELVRDNIYLASSKYGLFKRVASDMAGLAEQKTGNWFQNFFDIGLQNEPSEFAETLAAIKKFWNPYWEPNLVETLKRQARSGEVNEKIAELVYRQAYDTTLRHALPLDAEVMKRLAPEIQKILPELSIDDILMESNESIMITLGKVLSSETIENAEKISKSGLLGRLKQANTLYTRSPRYFDMLQTAVSDIDGTRMLDKYTETKRFIQQELIAQLDNHKFNFDHLASLLPENKREQLTGIRALNYLTQLLDDINLSSDKITTEAIKNKRTALSRFVDMFSKTDGDKAAFGQSIEKIIRKYNPWWGKGPGQKPENLFGNTPYLVMNKAVNPIKAVNEVLSRGGNVFDVIRTIAETTVGQLGIDFGFGFRAGRKNLDKVTTLTAASYNLLQRVNDLAAGVGLGLSQKSTGSLQDLFVGLSFKRYYAALLGISAIGYLAYEFENFTGSNPAERLGRTYVNMHRDVARIRDITGITSMNKMFRRMMPGSEKLFQNPIGGIIKYGTFGIIGDDRDYEETDRYWRKGEDPIRRGRWWPFSTTPFYGAKIDHYAPNWYRRLQSDYKYTDVLYGSKDEYWANHWMPTPRYPLAPIRHFLIDPNHWANKHREDRPYPISGGIQELTEFPIIGPVLDGTIGNLLNPRRKRRDLEKAHRQYLREINESIVAQASAEANAYAYFTPSGQYRFVDVAGVAGGGEDGEGEDVGVVMIGGGEGAITGGVPVVDASRLKGMSGSAISRAEITLANRGIVARASISNIRSRSLDDLRDEDFVEDLRETVDPGNPLYRMGNVFANINEMAGFYGFAFRTLTGVGRFESSRPVLETADDLNSYRRHFWNLNLGGLGGDLSEVTRRFVPARRNENFYNPFRNKMPDWMPGPEYFIDFKHGDPYTKISNGEYRLPGAGYESLNRLHPDIFGEYGALDRFKILADVAPYSEQYRYYKKVLSIYNRNGWLTDEQKEDIRIIKKQVQEAKKKYDFTPYKFKYADIEKRQVTIAYRIDDTTFMTEEFPDHPIRLAGIKMPAKSDESPAAQAAREFLYEHIKPGARVTIGIDADALFRVRDDTMQTMRAVVWDNGVNINAALARSKWGGQKGVVEANWDDTSATTIHALYRPSEITIGKVWEAIAHLDTPLHTKFLQVRSPLEMYKRRELYGKAWQSWQHPIRDFIVPTIESFWSKNPLLATGLGAIFGSLFGANKNAKIIGAAIGGLVSGVGSSIRTLSESTHRLLGDKYNTYIPKRRQLERDINEYFDMLAYVKYRGLYERTRQLALRKEGVDVEDLARGERGIRGALNKMRRRQLEQKKRWIKINMANPMVANEDAQAELDEVNAALREIDSSRVITKLGPYSILALKYKSAYESTLYGADPHGPTTQIYRALPAKDREFFKEFVLASPKEREEILRLVPKNQRRFYQAKWGLKVDSKPNLAQYFATHYLPSASWEGWRPDVSLEAIKLKVVQNEAVDMGEFGFYPGDEKYAKGAPKIKPFKPSGFLALSRLRRVLNGMGLKNVDINYVVAPSDESNKIDINLDLKEDKKREFKQILNDNLRGIFA